MTGLKARLARLERQVGTVERGVHGFQDLDRDGRVIRTWVESASEGGRWRPIPAGEPLPENLLIVRAIRSPCSLGNLCGGALASFGDL